MEERDWVFAAGCVRQPPYVAHGPRVMVDGASATERDILVILCGSARADRSTWGNYARSDDGLVEDADLVDDARLFNPEHRGLGAASR